MRSVGLCVATVFLAGGLAADAQSSKKPSPPRKAPAAEPAPLRAEAQLTCPAELGLGVKTRRRFCDVMTGQDPKDGLLITIPPHRGPVALSFELHNRHMYSEELIKAQKAFRQYTATIGVLTMDNTLIDRAVVQSEFRTAADLVDRIEGSAGAGGVKAVAPAGAQVVQLELPEDVGEQVSLLGEVLKVRRPDGDDLYTTPGRPIATISNVMLEYRPAPVRAPAKAPAKKPAAKPPAATPKKP
jgi:hypothetical protein